METAVILHIMQICKREAHDKKSCLGSMEASVDLPLDFISVHVTYMVVTCMWLVLLPS